MEVRAPLIGWGALFLSALIAALLPASWQLGYAATMIAVLGLPHGAADLALVQSDKRITFLAAYLITILLIVLVWQILPGLALSAFLLLSLTHFAIDGQIGSDWARRWAVASALIAGPAILHRAEIATLFGAVGMTAGFAAALSSFLRAVGIGALAVLLVTHLARRPDPVPATAGLLAIGTLVIAPPLIGFAIGFFALHAYGQTIMRQKTLELSGLGSYLIRTLPILLGAAIVLLAIILYAPPSAAGVRTLFVAISALAVPHMLVTPFWMRPSPARDGRSAWLLPIQSLKKISHRATAK